MENLDYQEKIVWYIKNRDKIILKELTKMLWLNHPQKTQARLDTLERKGYISKIDKKKYIIVEDSKEEIQRLKNIEKEYIKLKEIIRNNTELVNQLKKISLSF